MWARPEVTVQHMNALRLLELIEEHRQAREDERWGDPESKGGRSVEEIAADVEVTLKGLLD